MFIIVEFCLFRFTQSLSRVPLVYITTMYSVLLTLGTVLLNRSLEPIHELQLEQIRKLSLTHLLPQYLTNTNRDIQNDKAV